MPDYTTATELRTRTNIPAAVVDATLTAILDGVEAAVELYLGYDPAGGSFTDYLDGTGTPYLVLPRKGVTAVSSVYVDAAGHYGQAIDGFPESTLLDEDKSYALQIKGPDRTGVLVRYDGVWPVGRLRAWRRLADGKVPTHGSVCVTYSTSSITDDVVEAAYLEAAARYMASATGYGVQTSSSLDARSVSVTPFPRRQSDGISSPFVSPIAEQMLAMRRRKAIY